MNVIYNKTSSDSTFIGARAGMCLACLRMLELMFQMSMTLELTRNQIKFVELKTLLLAPEQGCFNDATKPTKVSEVT